MLDGGGVPYVTSSGLPPHSHAHAHAHSTSSAQFRCNTLGRVKNLEMTEYQKQKLINEANTVRIKVVKNDLFYYQLFKVQHGNQSMAKHSLFL